MIRCVIIDDEDAAIEVLRHYVEQTPHLKLVASFLNPIEAIDCVNNQNIDLIFLDIEMPQLSGIDFIKTIQGKSKIIFTTAYSDFAMEGYELDVVDYLLKPIRLPRFLAAVQKYIDRTKSLPSTGNSDEDFIFVKTEAKGKFLKIDIRDIDFIEGMKNYVAIHQNGHKTMVYTSMKEIEERLPKTHFIRLHKSFIVSLSQISGVEGNVVKLKKDYPLIPVGDSYKSLLSEIIKSKMIQ